MHGWAIRLPDGRHWHAYKGWLPAPGTLFNSEQMAEERAETIRYRASACRTKGYSYFGDVIPEAEDAEVVRYQLVEDVGD